LLDEPPDMTPSFPRTGVSGHAGAVQRAELISGGSHEKPKTIATPAQSAAQKGLVQGLTKQSLPNESTHRDAPMAQHAGLLEQRAQRI
ncbi:hypothetical protein, partial [Mycobacterium tuberculosis]